MKFANRFRFSRLPTIDEDFDHELESKIALPIRGASKLRLIVHAAAVLLTIFLFAIFWLVISRTVLLPSPSRWSSCGDNPDTARSRGCSFDLLSFAWQTPECYDSDLMAEFADWEGEWSFYADDKFTQPISQQIAIRGDRTPLFVKVDYHMVHCTFMWRQMHRAYENGWIDAHLANYNHTLHCQMMLLMDPVEAAKKAVMARVIYPECLKVKH